MKRKSPQTRSKDLMIIMRHARTRQACRKQLFTYLLLKLFHKLLKAIVTMHNTFTAEASPYEMECGNETDDKVYLFTYTGSKIVSDDIRGCGIEWWLRSPGKEQDNAVYILGKAANLMGIPQCVSCNHYCKRRSHFKIQSGAEHTYWISVLSQKALTALFSIIE